MTASKEKEASNDLLLSQAHGLLAPKVKLPQISVCVSTKPVGGFKHFTTMLHPFLHFSGVIQYLGVVNNSWVGSQEFLTVSCRA